MIWPSSIFDARPAVIVAIKFESSPRAAASSFNVSKAPGAPPIRSEIADVTKEVLAICDVLLPDAAVGTDGKPVKVGERMLLFKFVAAFWALSLLLMDAVNLLSSAFRAAVCSVLTVARAESVA